MIGVFVRTLPLVNNTKYFRCIASSIKEYTIKQKTIKIAKNLLKLEKIISNKFCLYLSRKTKLIIIGIIDEIKDIKM